LQIYLDDEDYSDVLDEIYEENEIREERKKNKDEKIKKEYEYLDML
jgi:hypothetical protein